MKQDLLILQGEMEYVCAKDYKCIHPRRGAWQRLHSGGRGRVLLARVGYHSRHISNIVLARLHPRLALPCLASPFSFFYD